MDHRGARPKERREEGADRKSSDQKLEEGSTQKLQDARRNDSSVYSREVGGRKRRQKLREVTESVRLLAYCV